MFNIFKKENAEKVEPMAFVFIGRSGCGKGTQVELLKEELKNRYGLNILHLETGSFFREFIKGNSYTQVLSKKTVDSGGLMPGALAMGLWVNYLAKHFTGKENLFFDGAPRKLQEAELLDGVLNFYGIKRYKVVYMNVGKKWSHDRLLARGRKDDTEEGIEKRMAWFDKDVIPCVEYFRNNQNCDFLDINGEQTIEEVRTEINKKVFNN
jgi:adenylate kinase family enzyme